MSGLTPLDFTIGHLDDSKGYWEAEVFGMGQLWRFNRKHGSWLALGADCHPVVAEELQAEVGRIERSRRRVA